MFECAHALGRGKRDAKVSEVLARDHASGRAYIGRPFLLMEQQLIYSHLS